MRVMAWSTVRPCAGGPGRDDPLRVHDHDLTADPIAGVRMRFDPPGQRRHRRVIGGVDFGANVVVADGPQHRYQLRFHPQTQPRRHRRQEGTGISSVW